MEQIVFDRDFVIQSINALANIAEIIGIIAIFLTFKNEREVIREEKTIKESEFLIEYNFQFISSENLIEMERVLESCQQQYKRYEGKNRDEVKEELYSSFENIMKEY